MFRSYSEVDVGCYRSLRIMLSRWGGKVHIGRRLLKLVLLLSRRALLPGCWVLLLLLLVQLRSLRGLLLRLKLLLGLVVLLLTAALVLPAVATIRMPAARLLGLRLA